MGNGCAAANRLRGLQLLLPLDLIALLLLEGGLDGRLSRPRSDHGLLSFSLPGSWLSAPTRAKPVVIELGELRVLSGSSFCASLGGAGALGTCTLLCVCVCVCGGGCTCVGVGQEVRGS